MRRLTTSPQRERGDRGDRGVVLVWVALMMTVLLGIGALVVDFGALYQERRELQNAADAASLAVAKDCAGPTGCGDFASTASAYTALNVNGGGSSVDWVCGTAPGMGTCASPPSLPAGVTSYVGVRTVTPNVNLLLAPIVGALSSATVRATAYTAWGAAASADTPPLAIALCTFTAAVGGSVPNGQEVWLYFHDPTKESYQQQCAAQPAGGFGWIQNNNCTTSVDADGIVGSDPGNNATQDCFRNFNGDPGLYGVGDVVPVALYSGFTGSGNNATYTIVGIAGMEILGYRFPSSRSANDFKCLVTKENSCLWARFTTVVTSGSFGGGTNYGASVIALVG
jgi:Flp pilus assembly protein TadG